MVRPSANKIAVGRGVAETERRTASAQKDMCVPTPPRNSRLRAVLAQNGLPDPAVTRRVACSPRFDKTPRDAGQERDTRVKVRWHAPASSVQVILAAGPRLVGVFEAPRYACGLESPAFCQAPRDRVRP